MTARGVGPARKRFCFFDLDGTLADTDPDIARYSILKGNEQIFATKYQLNIPTPEELTEEVAKQRATLLIQLAEQEGGDAK